MVLLGDGFDPADNIGGKYSPNRQKNPTHKCLMFIGGGIRLDLKISIFIN